MIKEQFDRTKRLFAAVFRVADSLGSEASEPAQLILTERKTFDSCQAFFPAHFTIEALTREQLTATYLQRGGAAGSEAVKTLLDSLPDAKRTFGIFREDSCSFWLCVFFESGAQIGSNALFRAHRVET